MIRRILRAMVWTLLLSALACSPNKSILEDKSAAGPSSTPTPEPTASSEPVRRFTVAELMQRVADAPPDSFLFPCNLNAYSDDRRASLRKVREAWLKKESDDRYHIDPATGCVCPGICVMMVQDGQKPSSWGLVVLDEKTSDYVWLARDLDLSRSSLTWTGTTPKLIFKNDSGAEDRSCAIGPEKGGKGYVIECTDAGGRRVLLAR